ncbi:hypothetical protein QR685DRAFT_526995 [Neurospora intermedia]|uniref:Secreted protein n=1 Tax=Neurospora intermedia TaxID=5142 RepID=A0ABR3DA67_NEUIN
MERGGGGVTTSPLLFILLCGCKLSWTSRATIYPLQNSYNQFVFIGERRIDVSMPYLQPSPCLLPSFLLSSFP